MLIEQAPEDQPRFLEYALLASRWSEDNAAVLALFDHLTELHIKAVPSLIGPVTTFQLDCRAGPTHLREAWTTILYPNLTEAAKQVISIVDHHLRHGYRLLTVAGQTGPSGDPLTSHRSAIEPHPQHQTDDAIDVLLDAGRDCLDHLLDSNDPLGRSYLDAWAASDVPILNRLAIHGCAHRSDVNPTVKIEALRSHGWLFDHHLHHEAFQLIAGAIAGAATPVADALIDDILAGPSDAEGDSSAYQTFNTLVWVVRHAPNLQSASEALQSIRLEHPQFEERPYPDLLSWWSSGPVAAQPPLTTTELHELIETDPVAAVSELRRYEDVKFPDGGPTWNDALDVLKQTVAEWPTDGLLVLKVPDVDATMIPSVVVRAWTETNIEPDAAVAIVDQLKRIDLAPITFEISLLLSRRGEPDPSSASWQRVPGIRQLAMSVWAAMTTPEDSQPVDNWLNKALGHPSGHLALFWANAIAADWRDAGDAWAGIPEELASTILTQLSGDDDRTAVAQVIFGSQLLFFYGADKAWCEEHIRPLLEWTDPPRARRTWDGYLSWGRWNDELLAGGLLDTYLDAVRHRHDFGKDSLRQLWSHLAQVGVFSSADRSPWARTLTTLLEPAERIEGIEQISWHLGRISPPAVEDQWQQWMKPYWQDRVDSIPNELTLDEASALAAWSLKLTDSLEEGVSLALTQPARLDQHGDLLHRLSERLDDAPATFARLLAHLLRHTEPPFWEQQNLEQLIQKLRTAATPEDMTTITEQALRLDVKPQTLEP